MIRPVQDTIEITRARLDEVRRRRHVDDCTNDSVIQPHLELLTDVEAVRHALKAVEGPQTGLGDPPEDALDDAPRVIRDNGRHSSRVDGHVPSLEDRDTYRR